jgi:hypothetical protein
VFSESDIWTDLFTKTDYYAVAAQSMNHSGEAPEGDDLNNLRTRIALYLTRGDVYYSVGRIDTNASFQGNFLISTCEIDDALNVFEQVLNIRGSNIPALIGMVLLT